MLSIHRVIILIIKISGLLIGKSYTINPVVVTISELILTAVCPQK